MHSSSFVNYAYVCQPNAHLHQTLFMPKTGIDPVFFPLQTGNGHNLVEGHMQIMNTNVEPSLLFSHKNIFYIGRQTSLMVLFFSMGVVSLLLF